MVAAPATASDSVAPGPRVQLGREIVTLHVLGTPAPKGSSRPMLNRKTGKAFTFRGGSPVTAAKLDTWDGAVRASAANAIGAVEAPPFVELPLTVTIVFRLARPGGHWGKGKNAGRLIAAAPTHPRGKPDIDKLARSTLDSLTGIVFDDDSRIVTLTLSKTYAAPGNEGATITIAAVEAARELPR
jgi:Holliday junction resolvase RusA-like endonuclease